jgi:Flp pilus assembly protein TadG
MIIALRRVLRLPADEAGTAAIEFAVVLPVFLAMLYGLLELGHYGYTTIALSDAARDGARWAMVRGASSAAPATASDITNFVRGRIAMLDPAQVTVTPSFTPNNKPGSVVNVQVSYAFAPFLPSYGFIPASTVSDSAKMTIAY